MNCTRCSTPLANSARFCPNCGLTLQQATGGDTIANLQQNYQPENNSVNEFSPTKPVDPTQLVQPQQPQQLWLRTPDPSFQPTQYVIPNSAVASSRAGRQGTIPAAQNPRRRRRVGCLGGCLITILILAILLVGGWIFALHPYVNALAKSQIDVALSDAVNQIPPAAALTPPGIVAVQEKTVNNLIVLNSAPSDIVQNVHMLITPNDVELNFQVQANVGSQMLSMPGSFTAIPQVINGQLVVTQVQVSPVLALVVSPDDLTTLINARLAEAQGRFRHPIKSVSLKNHELDLLVGPPIL